MRHEACLWVGDYLHVSVVILGVLGGRWSLKLRLEILEGLGDDLWREIEMERLRILIL